MILNPTRQTLFTHEVIACVFLLLCAGVLREAEGQSKPLTVADALGLRSLGEPISLSPDGQWVAYGLIDARKREAPNDPRYLYYTRTGAWQEAVGSDIWITNTRTTESRNLTGSVGANWGPVWSPDGKYLAFYSDRSGTARLWVWEKESANLRQLSGVIVRPFFNFEVVRWTADSRDVLVKVLPEDMTLEQAADYAAGPVLHDDKPHENGSGVTATVYRYSPASNNTQQSKSPELEVPEWSKSYLSDLALIDVRTGAINRIARRTKALGYWFSPDGRFLAYTSYKARRTNTQEQLYDLYVITLSSGVSSLVAGSVSQGYGIWVSWAPDGHALAFLSSTNGVSGSDCFVVPATGGEPRNITSGAHPPFGMSYRAPLWDVQSKYVYFISSGIPLLGKLGSGDVWRASAARGALSKIGTVEGKSIMEVVSPVSGGRFWSPDGGRSLTVRTRDEKTKDIGFYRMELDTGIATKLLESHVYADARSIFMTDVSADGKTLVYAAEDANHPAEIWMAGPTISDSRRLTNTNPDLDHVPLGPSRLLDWTSLDGQLLHGALLLPPQYKKDTRYPLVVYVYGGSFASDDVNRFGLAGDGGDNMQILATRGYAVLAPDAPLGTGTRMQDLAKTVLPGVERAIETGIADPNRIGVMGASYGGYSTLALITQSKMFRAAVAGAAASDLISNYGTMDSSGTNQTIGSSETGQGGMGGTPWQFRDRYIENSPIFYLDHISTPLLLVHGSLDRAVSPHQPEEVFVGLRRLNKEVVYVKYAGEDHWPGSWSQANVTDYWNRVIDWFDTHLKEAPTN